MSCFLFLGIKDIADCKWRKCTLLAFFEVGGFFFFFFFVFCILENCQTLPLLPFFKELFYFVFQKTAKLWEYFFRYVAGSEGTICSSLALLKLDPFSKKSFTLKGWLSENKVSNKI